MSDNSIIPNIPPSLSAIRSQLPKEKWAEIVAFWMQLTTAVGGVGVSALSLGGEYGIAANLTIGATAIASYLLGGYAHRLAFERLTDTFQAFQNWAINHDDQIHLTSDDVQTFVYESLNTEDGIDLISNVIERAPRERLKQKRRWYGAFLADRLVNKDSTYEEDLRLLNALDGLTDGHIDSLQWIRSIDWDSIPNLDRDQDWGHYIAQIEPKLLTNLPEAIYFDELQRWHLFTGRLVKDIAKPDDIFSKLGKRFLAYLSGS